ncbi:pyruvate:ferredoxin (flavodoxin) oxidoreductase [Atribacter laminatus]|uniref:Pyruvate-flavodoxin oxidoreductase n=1 Tax=Atribacter laminatus TaxID=2847778 RepID=A0A7T1F2S1_ATRLM|nr:pyruvate:ferredoxin (flavodoxin) oxidoreductase [Atribacter laminatus]QPM67615.1 Pyruvate-flavodoxin oxidoreductase [Atribacter laminatus]
MTRELVMIDGNEATTYSAYHVNEVIAIYPITPSSTMGELADQWAAEKKPNIWGTIPHVIEMQSEGGASGALHGAVQAGALGTTFTNSQGLLLMIPNMYKIAGELTPALINVAARTIATHALSIFCDHSDVMTTRETGFALISSNSPQEAMDFALISQAATLESRVPFLHFFDGFRTSSEIAKVELLSLDDMRAMIDNRSVEAFRNRKLSPDQPFIRGTAQNPDVFFQSREACNPFYLNCPNVVEKVMERFEKVVGRKYHLFDYYGAPDAESVIVIMGSGAETTQETVEYLNQRGEKLGVIKTRLYRPFSITHFVAALPKTVKTIIVLDRTKEPGSVGEPMYIDVKTALSEAMEKELVSFEKVPRILGGRYGLSSKEFTPAMVKAVFDEAKKEEPKNHFTIGIDDDVTHTSLEYDPTFSTEDPKTVRALFYGLGSDGTVGANKNSIKIIGLETDNYAQGYFVYDSKKAGAVTVSHLRFGPKPIHSPYLINRANFLACHQFTFLERFDMLKNAEDGAIFLLNSPFGPDETWEHLPKKVQEQIINKKLRFFVIDGYKVAQETGMGGRINTILQTCFFAISGVLPRDLAIQKIKESIQKTYGKRGEAVVKKNFAAVDAALGHLHEVKVPSSANSQYEMRRSVPLEAPEFVQKVTAKIIANEGDSIPVSDMPIDGTFPSATTQWERRNIALQIPVWDPEVCIQCGKCTLVCPHAVIRGKIYDPEKAGEFPPTFKRTAARWKEFPNFAFTIQVSPEDCTGCGACIKACPAKNKKDSSLKALNFAPQIPLRQQETENWKFFKNLPDPDRDKLNLSRTRDVMLLRPLFEFSGACAGCGETPYVKLMSQLFGDRAIIANATGCSSIYGGNLPTTPYAINSNGKGPAWSNSLFEDNAEFGLGMRLAIDKQKEFARELLLKVASSVGTELVDALLSTDQSNEEGIKTMRELVSQLKAKLSTLDMPDAKLLLTVADSLVKKSVWILGGDGWAYDIGYGGLDHVLASGRNVNVLVLDTEVYSNTGGQMSKATPRGAVAKFAAAGKGLRKKDLALISITYGNIYVARVAMGADDIQTIKAFLEAEAYDGPSIIIAYCHCINHGFDLVNGMDQQKKAVQSGYWPLIRYNPDLVKENKNPLQIDSKAPSLPLDQYIYNETRYSMLKLSNPEQAQKLLNLAEKDVASRWKLYQHLAAMEPETKE